MDDKPWRQEAVDPLKLSLFDGRPHALGQPVVMIMIVMVTVMMILMVIVMMMT